MLRSLDSLRGFELFATDGELGTITEFYFDDLDWAILYMAIDTGSWLPGRKVLVPPASLGEMNWVGRTINVLVTRDEIATSPEIELHQPYTREQEIAYFAHFGWPCLWTGEVRSVTEIRNVLVVASDSQPLGQVDDLVVEDDLWIVRYLNLSVESEHKIESCLIPTQLIHELNWRSSRLLTSVEGDLVRKAPEFDPRQLSQRPYEQQLFNHYAIEPYW